MRAGCGPSPRPGHPFTRAPEKWSTPARFFVEPDPPGTDLRKGSEDVVRLFPVPSPRHVAAGNANTTSGTLDAFGARQVDLFFPGNVAHAPRGGRKPSRPAPLRQLE